MFGRRVSYTQLQTQIDNRHHKAPGIHALMGQPNVPPENYPPARLPAQETTEACS
jgi:hypothetical protein